MPLLLCGLCANPITAGICTQFCERMFESLPDETDLSRSIRTACLNSRGEFPNAEGRLLPGQFVEAL